MAQWLNASRFTAKTPKNAISLSLQSLSLELHGDPSCVPKEDVSFKVINQVVSPMFTIYNFFYSVFYHYTVFQEVKGALLCTVGLCGEAQLQVKWCQLSVLALNRVKVTTEGAGSLL